MSTVHKSTREIPNFTRDVMNAKPRNAVRIPHTLPFCQIIVVSFTGDGQDQFLAGHAWGESWDNDIVSSVTAAEAGDTPVIVKLGSPALFVWIHPPST